MTEQQLHGPIPLPTRIRPRVAAGGSNEDGGFWLAVLRHAGRVLKDALFPRRCAACRRYWTHQGEAPSEADEAKRGSDGSSIAAVFQRSARRFLCPDCLGVFEPVVSPLCCRCGVIFASREGEDHLCGDCLQKATHFRRARAAGIYNGGLMALVHQLKYRGCLALIDPLALLLQEAFHRHWQATDFDLVLPVPLHVVRLRRRGFNQAQLLTDAWACREESDNCPGPRFPKARQIIVRSRSTLPQTGLGKAERRRNIRGAFSVLDPRAVAGRRILLVDDVYTTGATANEAARALKRSGADWVDILTVARTMPRAGWR